MVVFQEEKKRAEADVAKYKQKLAEANGIVFDLIKRVEELENERRRGSTSEAPQHPADVPIQVVPGPLDGANLQAGPQTGREQGNEQSCSTGKAQSSGPTTPAKAPPKELRWPVTPSSIAGGRPTIRFPDSIANFSRNPATIDDKATPPRPQTLTRP